MSIRDCITEKSLIEIDGWALKTRSMGRETLVGICHTLCVNSWMYHYAKGGGRCASCAKEIPAAVMAVWTLYNFDVFTDI